MELQLHAAVLISPNLFAALADDDCGLRAMYEWFLRRAGRAERIAAGNRNELHRELVFGPLARLGDFARFDVDFCLDQGVLGVLAFSRMLGQLEELAGIEFAMIARAGESFKVRLEFFDTDLTELIAVAIDPVEAGVVVDFKLRLRMF